MTFTPSVITFPSQRATAATVRRHRSAAAKLADWLVRRHAINTVTTLTWLNHYSGQVAFERAPQALGSMQVVGLDGLLLCGLVGQVERTSADLVAPLLLPRLENARVLLLGGPAECAATNAECIGRLLGPTSKVVGSFDGYDGLPTGIALADVLRDLRPTVVLVGIGAARQEQVASVVAGLIDRGLVMTCGGYLDQARKGRYYPRWAFPLRLNWLVRLIREPSRLWRRYTVDAWRALRRRSELSESVRRLEGFQAYQSILTTGTTVGDRLAVGVERETVIDLRDRTDVALSASLAPAATQSALLRILP